MLCAQIVIPGFWWWRRMQDVLREPGQTPQGVRFIEIADELDDAERLQTDIPLSHQGQDAITSKQLRQGTTDNVAAADDK
jgi:hypothetical protein